MKSIKIISITLILLSAATRCSKEVETTGNLSALTPSRMDETAGTWVPIILTTNYSTQVPVAAPVATSTDAYKAEIAAIVDAQSKLTQDQVNIINYWSAGGVLRWNQVFREMVAKYNLPPAPRADGSYVFPDAENPYADPAFPFANPPYAARAYSYLSVAQYDALKAAWYYKYLYNRPSPYTVDPAVKAFVPK